MLIRGDNMRSSKAEGITEGAACMVPSSGNV